MGLRRLVLRVHRPYCGGLPDTILPAFRANATPLDVLVTDTDFKSPSTWNGWEMDPRKYPDPQAFFDWSAAQGLHNSLNIHPSILGSDPQFAQAQATARNKLTKNTSCGADCYTFDWGDPDQLKAYLDLHGTMDRQGVGFWWLDWCCDSSQSLLGGVTPDAWINQQYAADADKALVLHHRAEAGALADILVALTTARVGDVLRLVIRDNSVALAGNHGIAAPGRRARGGDSGGQREQHGRGGGHRAT